MMTAAVTTNPNYNLTNTIISSSNHLQSPSHVVQSGGGNVSLLTTNQQQQMMMTQQQQHMQQNSQQQFAYHTQLQQQQQQHMQGGSNSNRLTNTMPPPSNYRQHQPVSGTGITTVAFPQLNNGEQLVYSYPPHAHLAAMTTSGGTITFLPTNPPPSIPPSLLRSSPSNTMTPHTPQTQLPAGLMQQSVQSTTAPSSLPMVYPLLAAAATTPSNKLSCFNCGSTQHIGANCQEVSMEDATRTVYKLDYNINLTAAQIQQQQQLQQSSTPPMQAVTSTITIAPTTTPINTPTLPATDTITKTKPVSLKKSGSENKLPPIILPEIVDLTNLSSSNSSSTNSLNGDSHK
jgi:hypothetical protein